MPYLNLVLKSWEIGFRLLIDVIRRKRLIPECSNSIHAASWYVGYSLVIDAASSSLHIMESLVGWDRSDM